MNEKLKPCPFCNGVAHLVQVTDESVVVCQNCLAKTKNWHPHPMSAVKAWNRRVHSHDEPIKTDYPSDEQVREAFARMEHGYK